MSSSEAFLLLLTGTLGIYYELVRPGRVVPALTGALLAAAGINEFAHMQLSAAGIALMVLSAALFLMEAFWAEASWRVLFLAGLGGMAALTFGAALLVPGAMHVSLALAVPGCVSFSSLTLFLCARIRRGRGNKRLDLAPEQVRPV